jgi:predicted small secreted protein
MDSKTKSLIKIVAIVIVAAVLAICNTVWFSDSGI